MTVYEAVSWSVNVQLCAVSYKYAKMNLFSLPSELVFHSTDFCLGMELS